MTTVAEGKEGQADAAPGLQQVLDRRGEIHIPAGTYLLGETLRVHSDTSIVADPGATFRLADGVGTHLSPSDSGLDLRDDAESEQGGGRDDQWGLMRGHEGSWVWPRVSPVPVSGASAQSRWRSPGEVQRDELVTVRLPPMGASPAAHEGAHGEEVVLCEALDELV